ncbi:MAG: aldose 1-epimerase [Candidatus Binatia bacterium]|jgi:aldose 1-epimerase
MNKNRYSRRFSALLTGVLFVALASTLTADADAQVRTKKPQKFFKAKRVKPMTEYGIKKERFGKTELNEEVAIYTLVNRSGMRAKITTYGAMLTSLQVPDGAGSHGEVALGFDNLRQYLDGHPYFGSTTGRVANRIAKGQFTLNGRTYNLAINNPPGALHGGDVGFDKRIWNAVEVMAELGPAVRFSYLSPDGEEGYPGNLWTIVTYTLTNNDELRIDYEVTTDKDTPINLTNHAYWNLTDGGASSILDHELEIFGDHYTPVDSAMIPTGEFAPVAGTVMDFTRPIAIGARIDQLPGDPEANDPGGYDHNYILRPGQGSSLRLIARAYSPQTGRVMEVSTTEPGVQLYTGNFLDGTLTGRNGAVYQQRNAFCLEAQHFPDSVNQPNFPNTILRPGQTYRQTTIHRFYTR